MESYRSKKRLRVIVVVVAFLIAFRALGLINLTLFKGHFENRIEVGLDSTTVRKDPKGADYKTGSYLVVSDNNFGGFHFRTALQDPVFGDVAQQVEKDLAKDLDSVSIKIIDLRGFYWIPLFKSGTCDYLITFTSANGDGPYSGEIRGSIDFSVAGFSSISDLKAAVGKEIANDTLSKIKSTLKSND